MAKPGWLPANWPAPAWVRAGTTLRDGGQSSGSYQSLNLALHVEDDRETVLHNRATLRQFLQLPAEPDWLDQVHGTDIVQLDRPTSVLKADAAVSLRPGRVCAILTADCVPVLVVDTNRPLVAALHVGWRGLSRQIIQGFIDSFTPEPGATLVWIGPHISSRHYEVDQPVRDACLDMDQDLVRCFRPTRPGHWHADLGGMVELIFRNAGIENIYNSDSCTYNNREAFYSHRRDGRCGRMASLIWMMD